MSIRIKEIKIFNEDTENYLERVFNRDNQNEMNGFDAFSKLLSKDKRNIVSLFAENAVADISLAYDLISNTCSCYVREKYNQEDVKNYKDNLNEAISFKEMLSDALFDNHNKVVDAIDTFGLAEDGNIENFLKQIDVPENRLLSFVDVLKSLEIYESKKLDLGNSLVDLDLNTASKYIVDINNPYITTENLFEDLYYEVAEEITINDLAKIENDFLKLENSKNLERAMFISQMNQTVNVNTQRAEDMEEIIDAEIVDDIDNDYSGMKI